ncbi:hypothetical protein ABZX39_32700 [Streptomyces collinus]
MTARAATRHRPVVDGAAGLHAQQRCFGTYAEFTRPAHEIGTVAGL